MNLRILLLTNNAEVVDRIIVTQRQLDSHSMCFYVIHTEMKSVTIQAMRELFRQKYCLFEIE